MQQHESLMAALLLRGCGLKQQLIYCGFLYGITREQQWKILPFVPQRRQIAVVWTGGLPALSGRVNRARVVPVAGVEDFAITRAIGLRIIRAAGCVHRS